MKLSLAFSLLVLPRLRLPLDKSEGGVKGKLLLSVFLAPFVCQSGESGESGDRRDIPHSFSRLRSKDEAALIGIW
jgi:hypothetical protein